MIKLENVSKQYVSGDIITTAVNNVSLTINNGDFVSIVGPSGSGKSTLINLLCGLCSPSSGKVFYNEYSLGELDAESIAKTRLSYIGQVFQDFRLIEHLSVRDNILLPLVLASRKIDDSIKSKLNDIASDLNLTHRLNHKPFNLSGGEQQRVSFARSLINDPSFIIADEPTGNLDAENTKAIILILKKLNEQGKGVIVVTHDEEVASSAKKKITFCDGQMETVY